MRHTGAWLGLIVSLAVGSVACSRSAEERAEAPDAVSGDSMTVTGCLTSAPDRGAYVVTANRNALTSGALHAGDGETPTYTYELTGDIGDLASHVGREVEVTGRLDEDRKDEVKVDAEEKTELPKTRSGDDTVKPAIETEMELNINVRRLQVTAVSQTGRACNAAQ